MPLICSLYMGKGSPAAAFFLDALPALTYHNIIRPRMLHDIQASGGLRWLRCIL